MSFRAQLVPTPEFQVFRPPWRRRQRPIPRRTWRSACSGCRLCGRASRRPSALCSPAVTCASICPLEAGSRYASSFPPCFAPESSSSSRRSLHSWRTSERRRRSPCCQHAPGIGVVAGSDQHLPHTPSQPHPAPASAGALRSDGAACARPTSHRRSLRRRIVMRSQL